MINELHADIQGKMNNAVDYVRQELATLRTGRANTGMVDHLKVDYYGSPQPLRTLASIAVPESRMILIEPYDKSILSSIERAILASDLGFNPNNDGKVIRIPIPQLTEERRKSLAKLAHTMVEEGKVSIRNIRRDGNSELKLLEREHDISADNMHRAMNNIQEMTDVHIKQLDELYAAKETEIMTD